MEPRGESVVGQHHDDDRPYGRGRDGARLRPSAGGRSGLLYLGLARHQTVQNANARLLLQLPGRIAALLDVLDATPDAERPAVIAAAQRPRVHVRLLDAPIPNLTNSDEPDANLLRSRIEAVLTVPRPVIVADRYRPADEQAGQSRAASRAAS